MPTLSELRAARIQAQRNKYMNTFGRLPGSPMALVRRSPSPRKSPSPNKSPARSPKKSNSVSNRAASPNLYGGRRSPNRQARFHISRALILTLIQITINVLALYYISKTRMRLSPENALKYRSFALENFRKFKNIIATRVPANWRGSIEASAAALLSVSMRRLKTIGSGRWSWSNYGVGAVGAYGLARATRSSANNFVGAITRYNNSMWGHISGSTAANAEQMQKVMAAMLAWIAALFRESMVTNAMELTRIVMTRDHIPSLTQNNLIEYGVHKMHLT